MVHRNEAAKLSISKAGEQPAAEDDELLTVKDVAGILKLPLKQVYGLGIPFFPLTRRRLRVRQSVFDAWLAAKESKK